jgi:hypothetical protein
MLKSWRKWCWCSLLVLPAADAAAFADRVSSPPTAIQTIAFRRSARRSGRRSTQSRQASGTRYGGTSSYSNQSHRQGEPNWAKHLDEPYYMHGERRSLGILP